MWNDQNYELIEKEISEREIAGFHVDSRLTASLNNNPRSRVRKELIDQDFFLRLQFHANNASRLLTPENEPRTIAHCVERMIINNWTFEILTQELNLGSGLHDPNWFNKCLNIYQNFSFDNFFSLFGLELTEAERRSTPTGSYSIFDGTHKSLVLGYKIIAEGFEYTPRNLFLFADRDLLVH